ncbi:MAG: DUF1344 domain-containing protein [Hyphomicrobiales bacterium]|nr:DUF1344 domain-containing protein [Hyphomicrobiales bacterium]
MAYCFRRDGWNRLCRPDPEGTVKAFDEATKTVTLEDGSAYVLAAGVMPTGITAGAKVQVTFDDTSKAATAVTVVQ